MDKKLSPLTLASYSRMLNSLANAGFSAADFTKKSAAICKYILGLDVSASYKKLYFSAILHSIRSTNPDADVSVYQKKVQDLLKTTKSQEESQRLNPKKEAELLPWPQIEALRGKVLEVFGENSTEYIIYCLYTLNPPVRLDYSNMKIVRSMRGIRPGKNYCVVSEGMIRFVFQEYKTSSKYGKVVIEASKGLYDVLIDWVVGKEYLLPIMQANSLGTKVVQIFQRVSGKSIGVSLLRHSYITWFLSSSRTIKEKKEVARKMLHSKELQEQYHVMNDSSDSD